jgi:hypothetical protein
MRTKLWGLIDSANHFLYEPTGLGRRAYRHRWHHNIHLMPSIVVRWVCYRYDLALGLTELEANQGRCVHQQWRFRCVRPHAYDGLCAKHYGKVYR